MYIIIIKAIIELYTFHIIIPNLIVLEYIAKTLFTLQFQYLWHLRHCMLLKEGVGFLTAMHGVPVRDYCKRQHRKHRELKTFKLGGLGQELTIPCVSTTLSDDSYLLLSEYFKR